MKDHKEVGDIIYPFENGTIKLFRRNRWDVILMVDKDGFPLSIIYLYCEDSARVLSYILKELKILKGLKRK